MGSIESDATLEALASVEPTNTGLGLQRTRLLAALAAANRVALSEVLGSLPPALESELSAEVAAARKGIELILGAEEHAAEIERAQSAYDDIQAALETTAGAGRAAQDAAADAAEIAARRITDLEAMLAEAKGAGPVTPQQELDLIATNTRINELQSVIVSLQTQLRQKDQVRSTPRLQPARLEHPRRCRTAACVAHRRSPTRASTSPPPSPASSPSGRRPSHCARRSSTCSTHTHI